MCEQDLPLLMTLKITQSAFLFPSCQDPGLWDSVDAIYSGVETDTGPCSELPAEEVCCPFLAK